MIVPGCILSCFQPLDRPDQTQSLLWFEAIIVNIALPLLMLLKLSCLHLIYSTFLWLGCRWWSRNPPNRSLFNGSICVAIVFGDWSSDSNIFSLAFFLAIITMDCIPVKPRPSLEWIQLVEVQLGKCKISFTFALMILSILCTSSNPWSDSWSWYITLLLITSLITRSFCMTIGHDLLIPSRCCFHWFLGNSIFPAWLMCSPKYLPSFSDSILGIGSPYQYLWIDVTNFMDFFPFTGSTLRLTHFVEFTSNLFSSKKPSQHFRSIVMSPGSSVIKTRVSVNICTFNPDIVSDDNGHYWHLCVFSLEANPWQHLLWVPTLRTVVLLKPYVHLYSLILVWWSSGRCFTRATWVDTSNLQMLHSQLSLPPGWITITNLSGNFIGLLSQFSTI